MRLTALDSCDITTIGNELKAPAQPVWGSFITDSEWDQLISIMAPASDTSVYSTQCVLAAKIKQIDLPMLPDWLLDAQFRDEAMSFYYSRKAAGSFNSSFTAGLINLYGSAVDLEIDEEHKAELVKDAFDSIVIPGNLYGLINLRIMFPNEDFSKLIANYWELIKKAVLTYEDDPTNQMICALSYVRILCPDKFNEFAAQYEVLRDIPSYLEKARIKYIHIPQRILEAVVAYRIIHAKEIIIDANGMTIIDQPQVAEQVALPSYIDFSA